MFAEGGSSNVLLIGLLLLAVAGMFLISRRNRKQQGSVTDFRASLAPGDEIMTASGQLGLVVAKDGDAVTIESAGTRSTWVVAAIQKVPPQFTAAADSAFGRAPAVDPAEDLDLVDPAAPASDPVGSDDLDPRTDDLRTDDLRNDGPDIDGGPTTPDARR